MPVQSSRDFALSIVEQLTAAGFQALWAGGCVRDGLLGIEPHDFDVATDATPEQVRELFGRKRTLAIGASFGVIVVLPDDRRTGQVEVATFRKDSTYSDGRRPDAVEYSTPEQDALRRDFTINGMFYDPLSDEVVDYVGGQEDLQAGVIRAIGQAEQRIAEDKLRMLRAIRFAARFGFELAEDTRQAISKNAADLQVVSGERMAEELRKTLATKNPFWALDELYRTGLLRQLLPAIDSVWAQSSEKVQRLLSACPSASWLDRFVCVVWASLDGEEDLAELLDFLRDSLKFSNDERDALRFAILSQAKLEQSASLPWSQMQPLVVSGFVLRAEALLKSRSGAGECSKHVVSWLRERRMQPMEVLDPSPLLSGADLIDVGLEPGPKFKELLSRAWQLQLDGKLADKTAAAKWLAQQTESG